MGTRADKAAAVPKYYGWHRFAPTSSQPWFNSLRVTDELRLRFPKEMADCEPATCLASGHGHGAKRSGGIESQRERGQAAARTLDAQLSRMSHQFWKLVRNGKCRGGARGECDGPSGDFPPRRIPKSQLRVTHPEWCNENAVFENFAVDGHGMLLAVATCEAKLGAKSPLLPAA